MKNFYSFGSKSVSSTFQTHAVGLNRDKDLNSKYYDQHMLILGNYSSINFPVVFRQEYGKKLQDILDTGWVDLYLISNRLKSILEENKLTGWKTFDVKVVDKKGEEVEGYYGLSITGRCGKIDYSKSDIIEKKLVSDGPVVKYYRGLHIGLDKWDGSDFFLPEKYFGIIVTKRTAEILRENKLTNIELVNLSEKEMSDSAVQVAIQNQNL